MEERNHPFYTMLERLQCRVKAIFQIAFVLNRLPPKLLILNPSLTFWPPDSAENPYIPALSEDRPKPDQSVSGHRLRVVP